MPHRNPAPMYKSSQYIPWQNLPSNIIHKKLYDRIYLNPRTTKYSRHVESILIPTKTTPHRSAKIQWTYNKIYRPYPPNTKHPSTATQPTSLTSQKSHILTWNASSHNTIMPCLHDMVTYRQTPPTIIAIQETKLSVIKSTKHIQNLFPHYKLFFNNTHNITRIMHQIMTYRGYRGELLLLIHNKHVIPCNLSKTPTPHIYHHSSKQSA